MYVITASPKDVQNNAVTYFDSLGVEHIPNKTKTFIGNKNIEANIFRIQAYDSIMCGYVCIGFIDFIHVGRTLTDLQIFFHQLTFKKR